MRPYISSLFDEPGHFSFNLAIVLISPYVSLEVWLNGEDRVSRWISAVSAVPYTEEIGRSVVDALLQIAHFEQLRPRITIDIWAWLKKRSSLPPTWYRQSRGTTDDIFHHIRGLGDIEILKSYFLLVWSEWHGLLEAILDEAATSIREDFRGIGMFRHREDLTERLDRILGQLDQGPGYLKQRDPAINEHDIQWRKRQYEKLKGVLLEVDRRAMETINRMYL